MLRLKEYNRLLEQLHQSKKDEAKRKLYTDKVKGGDEKNISYIVLKL